jgi:hypothetical protein
MATIAVSALWGAYTVAGASAVQMAVITAASYAAAAYVDSLWIAQLTKPDPIEGPRMGSLRLNTSDEGDPVQEPYGRSCRVPGHVLDVSDLIESRNTSVSNGKGGSGAEFTEYTYSCHAMISFGLGPAEDVTKIRANGKTIWAKYPNINISATDIAGVVSVDPPYTIRWGPQTTRTFANVFFNNTTKTLTFISLEDLGSFSSGDRIVWVANKAVVGLNHSFYRITGATVTVSGQQRTYVFSISADINGTGATIGGTTDGYVGIRVLGGDTVSSGEIQYRLTCTSPAGGTDLSQLVVGNNVLISEPSANYGLWKVRDSGRNANGSTFFAIAKKGTASPFFNFVAGSQFTAEQINPAFSGNQMSEAPNFHRGATTGLLGAEDAPIDELFESLRSPNRVPAYRGKIVVTLKGLQLFDFGNTLPQFEADVVQSSQSMLRDYVKQVCLDAGMLEDEVEADALSQPLLGLAMRGPQDSREKLAPVMMAYELVTSEVDGTLTFTHRNNVPEYTIEASDLSAREIGAETIRPVTFSDMGDEPADAVVVTYRSSARDYTTTVAQANRRAEAPRSTQRIDLSMLQMEAEDALKLATHIAYLAPVNRRQVEFTLPMSYVDRVREGVRLLVPVAGRTREVLVMSVTRGPTGVLEISGVLEQSSVFDMDVDTYQPPSPELAFVGTDANGFGNVPIDIYFLDIPPLRDEHRGKIGFYAAACSTSRSARFPGALIYQALDEYEEEWRAVGRVPVDSVIGQCSTVLGDAVEGVWDEINTVDVVLTSGELESVTALACLNGRNRATVGLEVIGFRSAELIDVHTYRLSGLLRGLRQTEATIPNHIDDESFILLTGKGLEFIELENAAQGMPRSYKVVTPGSRLPEAPSFSFTVTGATAQCFAPVNIRGTRDVSNNLTIEWTRVSRANVRLLSQQAIPMAEPFERYEVEIRDASDNLLRTMVVAGPFVVYTAAQQTADGITPGNTVLAFVRQLGDIVHAGRTRGAAL